MVRLRLESSGGLREIPTVESHSSRNEGQGLKCVLRTLLTPTGASVTSHFTHGLRRGLYSHAAPRLESPALDYRRFEIQVVTHTLEFSTHTLEFSTHTLETWLILDGLRGAEAPLFHGELNRVMKK